MVERRIKEARFPTMKSLDSFEVTAIASLNKTLVLELARCEFPYAARRGQDDAGSRRQSRLVDRTGKLSSG
jgi:hypothetical protein